MKVPPTPEVEDMVRELLGGWQDSDTLVHLFGLMQANLLSAAMTLASSTTPADIRAEAADVRVVAEGLAQFMEGHADRVEAGSN